MPRITCEGGFDQSFSVGIAWSRLRGTSRWWRNSFQVCFYLPLCYLAVDVWIETED